MAESIFDDKSKAPTLSELAGCRREVSEKIGKLEE
jgi:hypothetical protein